MLTRDFVAARLAKKKIDGQGRPLAPEPEPQPDQETNEQ